MGATAGMMVTQAGTGLMKMGAEQKNAQNEQVLAKFQADQLRTNAGQVQASAQREAIDIDREAQLRASRALAVAASSGGGASDPTVINLIAQNASEGAYRKAVALYEGGEQARAMNLEASGVEIGAKVSAGQSKARSKAMFLETGANMFGTYARGTSMRSKYG